MGTTAPARTATVGSPGRPRTARGYRRLFAVAAVVTVFAAATAASARPADGETALRDARAVAARHAGTTVMRISGTSMLPFFDGDAVIVTKPIDAARLRVGMIAVYRNRFGRIVAHRIVARERGGWRVRGYNNSRADTTMVNAGDLLGIIYAVFQPVTPDNSVVAATEPSDAPIAYAAPVE